MFDQLDVLPADPLLGLITLYNNDTNPKKVDLGVGVYRDEHGHTAIMQAIQKAEKIHMDKEDSKTYLGPIGVAGFVNGIKSLVLGESSQAVASGRVAGLQTPGGCGALRIGAELLKRIKGEVTVWASDPTWANHIPLISSAGLEIKSYPYFDAETGGIKFDAMDAKLAELGPNDILLLHGCCHNPTGADLSYEQWQQIAKRAAEQGFIPFVDIAYQGLGDGLEEDVKGVRYLSEHVEEMVIATSCSKNFGLYRERTGTLLVQTKSAENAHAIQTHVQDAARANYSMPPAYGGFLVDTVLQDPALRKEWEDELNSMAERVKSLRAGLLEKIQARDIDKDFSFIVEQKGMFSFLGISKEQVRKMREDYSIYMADSSRINVAGLNTECLDYVADALEAVLK
ncbi:aspartate/tyrosine/aromatic aminotransferase [Aliikangiella marina]|uniref:Aspartate/tyrosine/aromatic aminotransferase n=1 Tax=Aliikangiella marina TaxID=1712262 RepID=A0A545T314_9GAMM|nr:amino acid aminotransferase [Aliikangiella marina]TQV71588.1 aspartate/tyrosine/aromatic aminotransferase [Aliikangiella marina]